MIPNKVHTFIREIVKDFSEAQKDEGDMSDELLDLIRRAWDGLWPEFQKNPDELKRRLARRRMGMMNRPPRAWCLAIRAADTRIDSASAVIVPEVAGYSRKHLQGVEPYLVEHEVTLDAPLVRKLCAPVYTDWPYSTVDELMRRLGCSLHNIRAAIRAGVFKVRKIPDPLWGTTSRYLCEHVPDELCQTIRRVPERRGACIPGVEYTGWKWICPGCGGRCRTIFYPLPPLYWVQLLKKEFHDTDPDHPDALRKGSNTFACMKCHQVMYVTRLNYESWNRLVTHLSGGLLYGHEVRRPEWFTYERKRKYVPHLLAPPSRRRAQVLAMVLEGRGVKEIARELGISRSAAGTYASKVYRMNGVRNAEELRRKLTQPTEAAGDVDSEVMRGTNSTNSDKVANRVPLGVGFV